MMLPLSLIVSATGGRVCRRGPARFSGSSIDGRRVPTGGLWFAIRGEHHDGHDFADQAIASGARGLIVERGGARRIAARGEQITVIEVDDPTRALGDIAHAHRQTLPNLTVVGVTGSNGKTTTKEFVAAILSAHVGASAVHKTEGNFNNHLGLPLTLLGLDTQHRYAVIEMGMSAHGEIAFLARLAQPEIGVIVNVGPVHLETLGTIDEVARAKGELFAHIPNRGAIIFPDDDARVVAQSELSPAIRRLRFGKRHGVELRLVGATVHGDGTDVMLRLSDGQFAQARLRVVGAHNAINAAAAAAVACSLGIPRAAIERGLQSAEPAKHRSSVLELGGRKVIDDCYNASPLSTVAALETLAALKAQGRSIAVLGDMLELGAEENTLHRGIGVRAAQLGVDALVTLGPRARHIADGARREGMALETIHQAEDAEEAAAWVAAATQPGDWILVKGSRGMKLELVVDALRQRFATQDRGG